MYICISEYLWLLLSINAFLFHFTDPLRFLHFFMQAENAIIRLHRYAVWSESSLFVHAKMYSFSCCCTNYRFEDSSLNECKNSWHNKSKNSSWLIFIQKPLPVTLTMTSCLWFDLKKSKDLKLYLFDSEIILHFIWITPLMKIFFTRKCAVFTDTTLAAFVLSNKTT